MFAIIVIDNKSIFYSDKVQYDMIAEEILH